MSSSVVDVLGAKLADSLLVSEAERSFHASAVQSALGKGLHRLSPELMSYEAQVFLTWHNTGALPAGSMYEMDARLALVLLALAADFNGSANGIMEIGIIGIATTSKSFAWIDEALIMH